MTEIGLECEKGVRDWFFWKMDEQLMWETDNTQKLDKMDKKEGSEWVIVNADIDQALIQENPSWIK